ncbi:HIRAN domain-containing protein [Sphingomonas xinjiangensis]|uniref:HIRAN domain-containing protein n=1 Tax=Sphingomonas xinjiangensis TaxID=643568 RepID=A0A840YAI2_9SPHN|nr:hypothetical protein [Sphingomonas xinjiangensis]
MPRPALSLSVVGADYPNKRGPGRRFELQICQPCEPVQLVPEPKNPADEHAIAVFSCRGIQIGYLASERAVLISGIMARGEEVRAIYQQPEPYGAVIRVAFDGEEPVLPVLKPKQPPVETVDPEHDWYPDEEWPE